MIILSFTSLKPPRNRPAYAFLTLAILCAGLLWRSPTLHLSEFASKYGGDALWALFVFAAVACLFPRLATTGVAAIAMGFSVLVELSQLYHAPWLDAVRGTRLGALALGAQFNWPDLLAYAIGVGLGTVTELISRRIGRPGA